MDASKAGKRTAIKYVQPKRARGEDVVWVDVRKFDRAWKKSKGFYVGVHGTGGIGNRYDRFIGWLATRKGKAVEMPEVGLGHGGTPAFTNGRHRFAVLRDAGVLTLPVSVERHEAAAFRRKFGMGSRRNPDASKAGKRTAISRRALSVPARVLHERRLLVGRVLDYGAGRGGDTKRLRSLGIDIHAYDPEWGPKTVKGTFNTIMCNYVLNVLPRQYVDEIVSRIRKMLRKGGRAYITVRGDTKKFGAKGEWTSTGTFQRDVFLPFDRITGVPGNRMYVIKKR